MPSLPVSGPEFVSECSVFTGRLDQEQPNLDKTTGRMKRGQYVCVYACACVKVCVWVCMCEPGAYTLMRVDRSSLG